MFSPKPLKPEDVFTPRAANVNTEMYVTRPDLEHDLREALRGDKHIIVHGESGCGKSWLQQKVLVDERALVLTANLSNAVRLKSIAAELQRHIDASGGAVNSGYRETKSAMPQGVGLAHEREYAIPRADPFDATVKNLRARAGTNRAVIVFENLEQALDSPEILRELTTLIVLLDDPGYSRYDVRFLIVGTPTNIAEYLSKAGNAATLSNRLREIPEVSPLTTVQAHDLARRGLIEKLRLHAEDEQLALTHIAWVTECIPQHIHEYCLHVATLAVAKDRIITLADLEIADSLWAKESLIAESAIITHHLNSRETAAGRRSQTIYALGCCKDAEFRYTDIEQIVRREFAASTAGKQLDISGMLSQLSSGDKPIIKRTPKGDAYRMTSPKHRMWIRAKLRKSANGNTVEVSQADRPG